MAAPIEDNHDRTFDFEFGELLRTKRKDFQRAAYRILRNHHDAEDAVQTAIAQYLKCRASGMTIDNPAAFLMTVIHCTAKNALDQRVQRSQFHVNKWDCERMAAPEN